MPSNKDPNIIQPGPGKLPAGSVPASAMAFPIGGAGDLNAHITDPVDAHMSGAIGIPETYPLTSEALLSSVGGPIDGESVLDFIAQVKDLLPVRPNALGSAGPGVPNTGVPSWGNLDTILTGGWAKAGGVIPSHYLASNAIGSFAISGTIYPADRGVVALYKNTNGDFFSSAPGVTTLVAALWLGSSPSPAGIPDANFILANKTGAQAAYVASLAGLDLFSLTDRLPYLKDYASYGSPYAVYDVNFYAYQLAKFSLPSQSLAVGDAGSYLIIHWRESFATSLAAIQPANLTAPNLVASKCYSAVPSGGNFDDNTKPVFNVNRHNVFRGDIAAMSAPSVNSFTSANANSPVTTIVSGVTFTNATSLQFNVTLAANGLFSNMFDTGSVDSPPNVPTQFHSANDPAGLNFADFGGGSLSIPYYHMKSTAPGAVLYSIVNAPVPADVGEYVNATQGVVSPVAEFTPNNMLGYSVLSANLHKPFASSTANSDASKRYLYNTYSPVSVAPGSPTTVLETFVTERYRYTSLHVPGATDQVYPVVDLFWGPTSLATDTDSLQVITNNLTYPQVDWSAAIYFPAGNPNYSGLPGTDGVNHPRRHLRAFNTGIARNAGKLRLRFSAGSQASFTTNAAYDGTETTGHITGGMIVQVMVPGVTGWLDLGRALGDPGLATLDFYGCSTGVVVAGSDVTVSFQTTSFTANNTFGEFPLFVRVSLLNNAAGRAIWLDEVEWLAP